METRSGMGECSQSLPWTTLTFTPFDLFFDLSDPLPPPPRAPEKCYHYGLHIVCSKSLSVPKACQTICSKQIVCVFIKT